MRLRRGRAPEAAAARLSGVVHRYGAHVALDGLDLAVFPGETVALLGANGAGKSTTMALLLGLLRPQTGTVEVLGTSPRRAVVEGRVGAVLQTGSGSGLPPGVRVEQALAMVRRLHRSPAPLDDIVTRAGLDGLLGRRTHQLSGGQAQRVRFALAIAGDPALLVLDEPTSAMDVEGRRTFWSMIRRFGDEGRAVIFATHHLAEADQVAQRVVVVHHGRVVADGPGATLKAAVAARRVCFVCDQAEPEVLESIAGVTDLTVRGSVVTLDSLDADATVRALVRSGVEFRDLQVTGAAMEDVVVALTGGETRLATVR